MRKSEVKSFEQITRNELLLSYTLTTAQLLEFEFKSLMSPAPRGRIKPATFNWPRICDLRYKEEKNDVEQ